MGAWNGTNKLQTIATTAFFSLATLTATATSIVPPSDHGALAQRSELIVLAKAVESQVLGTFPALYTQTRFETVDRVKGPQGSSFLTSVPGGERDGLGWAASGSPRFE